MRRVITLLLSIIIIVNSTVIFATQPGDSGRESIKPSEIKYGYSQNDGIDNLAVYEIAKRHSSTGAPSESGSTIEIKASEGDSRTYVYSVKDVSILGDTFRLIRYKQYKQDGDNEQKTSSLSQEQITEELKTQSKVYVVSAGSDIVSPGVDFIYSNKTVPTALGTILTVGGMALVGISAGAALLLSSTTISAAGVLAFAKVAIKGSAIGISLYLVGSTASRTAEEAVAKLKRLDVALKGLVVGEDAEFRAILDEASKPNLPAEEPVHVKHETFVGPKAAEDNRTFFIRPMIVDKGFRYSLYDLFENKEAGKVIDLNGYGLNKLLSLAYSIGQTRVDVNSEAVLAKTVNDKLRDMDSKLQKSDVTINNVKFLKTIVKETSSSGLSNPLITEDKVQAVPYENVNESYKAYYKKIAEALQDKLKEFDAALSKASLEPKERLAIKFQISRMFGDIDGLLKQAVDSVFGPITDDISAAATQEVITALYRFYENNGYYKDTPVLAALQKAYMGDNYTDEKLSVEVGDTPSSILASPSTYKTLDSAGASGFYSLTAIKKGSGFKVDGVAIPMWLASDNTSYNMLNGVSRSSRVSNSSLRVKRYFSIKPDSFTSVLSPEDSLDPIKSRKFIEDKLRASSGENVLSVLTVDDLGFENLLLSKKHGEDIGELTRDGKKVFFKTLKTSGTTVKYDNPSAEVGISIQPELSTNSVTDSSNEFATSVSVIQELARNKSHVLSHFGYVTNKGGTKKVGEEPQDIGDIVYDEAPHTHANLETYLKSITAVSGDPEQVAKRTIADRFKYFYEGMKALKVPVDGTVKNITRSTKDTNITPFVNTTFYNAEMYAGMWSVLNELMGIYQIYVKYGDPSTYLQLKAENSSDMQNFFNWLSQYEIVLNYIDTKADAGEFGFLYRLWNEGDKHENLPALKDLLSEFKKAGFKQTWTSEANYVGMLSSLAQFYSVESGLSQNIYKGIAASATFTPMRTNVYDLNDAYSVIDDINWYRNFHLKYGYNRKLLYIDRRKDAASAYYTDESVGNLKVCTLKDMLKTPEVVLYTDDRYYNGDKLFDGLQSAANSLSEDDIKALSSAIKPIDNKNTEVKENTQSTQSDVKKETAQSVDESASDGNIFNRASAILQFDIKEALSNVWNSRESVITPLFDKQTLGKSKLDKLLMPQKDIVDLFENNGGSYTPLRGFAMMSAIIRTESVYRELSKWVRKPVFISSKDIHNMVDVSTIKNRHGSDFANVIINSVFNYSITDRVKKELQNNYRTTMDYNSPVYMDIYGNILTESGYVVIPAAANGSLQSLNYNPITVAFLKGYEEGYKIPLKALPKADNGDFDATAYPFFMRDPNQKFEDSKYTSKMKDDRVMLIKPQKLSSGLDTMRVSTASPTTKKSLYDYTMNDVQGTKSYRNAFMFRWIVFEVMKGAPLEQLGEIGLSKETVPGVAIAANYEELRDKLGFSSINSSIYVPNLLFSEDLGIGILTLYKIAMIVAMLLYFIALMVVVLKGQFTLGVLGKLTLIPLLVVLIIIGIPKVFELTYYDLNKLSLGNVAVETSMIGLEKDDYGVEITMQDVAQAENRSKFYMKLADLKISYSRLMRDALTAVTVNELKAVWDNQRDEANPLFQEPDIIFRELGVYQDVSTIYKSSGVYYNPETNSLQVYSESRQPSSFYSPYFYFLDLLTWKVNKYNGENGVYQASTAKYSNGKTSSLGLIDAYFNSEDFFNDKDLFDIGELYALDNPTDERSALSVFDNEQLDKFRRTAWVNMDYKESYKEAIEDNIDKLTTYAKEYAYKNKSSIGKMSDENFLKGFAMFCAVRHNQIFNVEYANSMEIFDMSTDDYLKLAIVPKDRAMFLSSYSYPRFVHEVAGTPGIVGAMILDVILFLSGIVKPASLIILFLAMSSSLIWHKIIKRDDSRNLFGMAKLFVFLIVTNALYAASLTAEMNFLPKTGYPAVNIFALAFFNALFLFLYAYITFIAVFYWNDLGDERISRLISFGGISIRGGKLDSAGRVTINEEGEYEEVTGSKLLDKLRENDLKRR